MDNKNIWILILLIMLFISMFDTKTQDVNIEKANEKIELSKALNVSINKELRKSKRRLYSSLDSIASLRKKDSLSYLKEIKYASKMKGSEVKKELLKDIIVAVDSSEKIELTLNESKGILSNFIESKSNLAMQGFKVAEIQELNDNLSRSIVFKEKNIASLVNVVGQKDLIMREFKKKRRIQIVKISVISFFIGGATVAILK